MPSLIAVMRTGNEGKASSSENRCKDDLFYC